MCLEAVANGTSKILDLANVLSDLEISTAFAKSLEVSFIVHLFRSRSLACLVGLGFSNKGLGISASLGFYHLEAPDCLFQCNFRFGRP